MSSTFSNIWFILRLYATDSATWVTTKTCDCKPNWAGNGSYNLINTVGLSILEVSYKALTAITKLLFPKSK